MTKSARSPEVYKTFRFPGQTWPMRVLVVDDDPAVLGSLELTRTEFALLELLARNPRVVLPRRVIFERVWGYDFGPDSNSLEVFVGYLRRKTEADGEPRLIQTVRGVGYVLREQ